MTMSRFPSGRLLRPHDDTNSIEPVQNILENMSAFSIRAEVKINWTVHTAHVRPMQAGVFDFDLKRSFSREFRLTRIPHTQTRSGVGRGGGYTPRPAGPPASRWRAAKHPERSRWATRNTNICMYSHTHTHICGGDFKITSVDTEHEEH